MRNHCISYRPTVLLNFYYCPMTVREEIETLPQLKMPCPRGNHLELLQSCHIQTLPLLNPVMVVPGLGLKTGTRFKEVRNFCKGPNTKAKLS
jgi:hypothetical protein